MLIWIRVLKFAFENPDEVNKQMVNVPFFDKFQKIPTCDNYIDGLVKSMAGLKITATPDKATVKRWLIDIEDSEEEGERETVKRKKKSKKSKSQ